MGKIDFLVHCTYSGLSVQQKLLQKTLKFHNPTRLLETFTPTRLLDRYSPLLVYYISRKIPAYTRLLEPTCLLES